MFITSFGEQNITYSCCSNFLIHLSIGIILCADKDHLDVEIALQDVGKPIGVAEYQLLLPKDKLQTLVSNELKKFELIDDEQAESDV